MMKKKFDIKDLNPNTWPRPNNIIKKRLKLSELKENEYYLCCLTQRPVFIKSTKIVSVLGGEAVEGIYYDLGRYRIAEYFDYMLKEV
jgi:hypothetical protein